MRYQRYAVVEFVVCVLPAAGVLVLMLPLVLIAVLGGLWWYGLLWLTAATGVASLTSIVLPRMFAAPPAPERSVRQIAGLVVGCAPAIFAFVTPGFQKLFALPAALAMFAAVRHTIIAVTGWEREPRE